MTPGVLKGLYQRNNPAGHFFDKDTMRFFGDTMSNFKVRDAGKVKTMTGNGIEEAEAWELLRRRPVKGGLHGHCAFFRKDNAEVIFNHG